jgi:hypothetical protein
VDNMLAVEGDVRGNDTIQPLMTHAGLGPHMTNAARFLPHCVRKLKNERLNFKVSHSLSLEIQKFKTTTN